MQISYDGHQILVRTAHPTETSVSSVANYFFTIFSEASAFVLNQDLARILHEGGRPMLDIYRNYKQLQNKWMHIIY